ncbi:MAG: hypothetical protein GC179_28495 [Anaerolineaceae bacterium]|nr:hypothetical protein [Anaerolineaceae bacterium]
MIGIQYAWDDSEKTVIRMYVGDYWDWDDLKMAMDGISDLMNEVYHQVDVITIMRPTTAIPEGNPTYHIKNAVTLLPANAGIHVMVGGNILINRTVRMLANTYACMRGRFFQTVGLGEAYRIIARNRPEIYEAFDMVS